AGAVDGQPALVEEAADRPHDVRRLLRVHLAGELDELRGDAHLPCLPGEVERVHRHTVAAQAWAGVEGHEAVRLRRAGGQHLPDLYAAPYAYLLELVHQRDVDDPEYVLEHLRDLRGAQCRHRHNALNDALVERHRHLQARWGQAGHHLGSVGELPHPVAR